MKLNNNLMPLLKRLKQEGYAVYTYTSQSLQQRNEEYNSLYWYENGRVLNVQKDYFGGYNLGVSYVPVAKSGNGNGCRLSPDYGVHPDEILKYRKEVTWVKGVTNYRDIKQFIKKEKAGLIFIELDEEGVEITPDAPEA